MYASIHAITYSRLKGCSTYDYTHTHKYMYMYTTGQNMYFQHSTDTKWKHSYGVYCTCVVVQTCTCIYMYMYTITCVGSEAKVASPVTRVDKHHKWIDVGSAHSASNNRSRVDHWALLHTTYEHKNVYIFGIYICTCTSTLYTLNTRGKCITWYCAYSPFHPPICIYILYYLRICSDVECHFKFTLHMNNSVTEMSYLHLVLTTYAKVCPC